MVYVSSSVHDMYLSYELLLRLCLLPQRFPSCITGAGQGLTVVWTPPVRWAGLLVGTESGMAPTMSHARVLSAPPPPRGLLGCCFRAHIMARLEPSCLTAMLPPSLRPAPIGHCRVWRAPLSRYTWTQRSRREHATQGLLCHCTGSGGCMTTAPGIKHWV